MDFKVLLSLSGVLTSLIPHLVATQAPNTHLESSAKIGNKSLMKKMQLNLLPSSTLTPHHVGALEEKWQFTSDHLPMGAKLDDFHIVTWNVLNSEYMGWIEMDTQGLKNSLIMQEHVYLNESGLTVRDVHVINQLNQMINDPARPRSIIALQECSRAFLQALATELPSHMKIIHSSKSPQKDQNILIYDSNLFTYNAEESSTVYDAFPSQVGRSLMDLTFIKNATGEKFRFINAHVPGDPNLPGRFEMADYAFRTQQDDAVTVLLGDMNFDDQEMQDAFNRASSVHGKENQFTNYVNDYSHIGTSLDAKCIDHLFIHFGNTGKQAFSEKPEEVLPELKEISKLLIN